jgi:zinc/manganese transport system substrate-binding protein
VAIRRLGGAAALVATVALAASACSSDASSSSASGTITAVGAENEYANVIAQIGGRYVRAEAIMSDPNTDPHTFEASPKVAQQVAAARLIVQNGLGYDTFMNKIESASSGARRTVIDVQRLLGLPDSTPNPHLWYKPSTMPAVAQAIARDLARIQPSHASYFQANLRAFDDSLSTWNQAIASFKSQHPDTPVATTEPVADYMLQAAGADNETPWAFQADVMNDVDPSPQNVTLQQSLFTRHTIKAFVYNQQVTDAITQSLLTLAKRNHIPVVGVYETMPTDGYTYQTWMEAEVAALNKAVTSGQSTTRL